MPHGETGTAINTLYPMTIYHEYCRFCRIYCLYRLQVLPGNAWTTWEYRRRAIDCPYTLNTAMVPPNITGIKRQAPMAGKYANYARTASSTGIKAPCMEYAAHILCVDVQGFFLPVFFASAALVFIPPTTPECDWQSKSGRTII